MSKIVIRDPKGEERTHELVDPITTVGRGSANTIQCKDREASRQHCRIEKTDAGFRLVDNRSRNGTVLNGQKVEVQDLRPGDVITIGGFNLQFDPPEGAVDEDFAATIEVAPLTPKEAAAPRASAGGEGKPKYVLEVFEGRQAGQSFELGIDALTIGRNGSNKFVIDDESASSYHAEISKEPTGHFITDLGSTNGTRVAGEKIVKTRLSPNAEIQIGTTKMRFRNVGAPAEEDEVFGTVVLDTERLERELAEDEVRARAAFVKRTAMAVAALIVVVGLFFAGRWVLRRPGGPPPPPPGNVLPNASFDGPIDEMGAPEGWRAESGRFTPWKVKQADRVPEMPDEKAAALVVAREGEARVDEYTQCRVRSPIDVQAGKSYRLGGWVRAPDAQGAYGFRVRWMGRTGDDRSAVEQAFVTGSQTAWKQKEGVFTPPTWATRAEVACYAIGNRGTVYFDDVFFAPVDKRAREDTSIAFPPLRAEFSPSGIFDIMSGTEVAVRKGELFFSGQDDAATFQEYADAERPRRDSSSSSFAGLVPEFASTRHILYGETARPGGLGLVTEYDLSADSPVSLARAGVRFTVTGAFGCGRMEVFGDDGPLGETSGEIEGAREVVFTVDKDTILAVHIGEGRKLRIEPRGDDKYMEVTLAGDTTLSKRAVRLAVEFNTGSRVELAAKGKLWDEHAAAERSGSFNGRYRALEAIIAQRERFKEDAEKAETMLNALKDDARREFAAADSLVEQAEGAVGSEQKVKVLLDELAKSIAGLKRKYADGPCAQQIVDLELKVAGIIETLKQRDLEESAARLLAEARILMKNNPDMAIKLLIRLEAQFAGTKAQKAAAEEGLREKCEAAIRSLKDRDDVLKRLDDRTRNLRLNEMYDEALQIIYTDPGYVKFKDDPEVRKFVERIEELARKKKAAGGGGGGGE